MPQMSPIASAAPTSWKCTSSSRDAVDAALGLGQPREHRLRALPRARGKPRGRGDQLAYVAPVPLGVLLLGHHAHASRGDRVAADAAHLEVESRHAEPRQRGAHGALVRAGVQQRAQQHVARHAGDGVHVQEPGHRAPPAARAMRAAIVPAPKPSSMFTTATPAAQEVSIESSADTPANEAP